MLAHVQSGQLANLSPLPNCNWLIMALAASPAINQFIPRRRPGCVHMHEA